MRLPGGLEVPRDPKEVVLHGVSVVLEQSFRRTRVKLAEALAASGAFRASAAMVLVSQ